MQLLYMEDLIRPELLQDIEDRLDSFVIDGVLDSGILEQLTEDSSLLPFPQFQTTERPDKCAAEILNGRILLLCDHSPIGMLLPAAFSDFLQVSEDHYNRFEIVSLQRLIRYAAVLFTMLFSGTYLAVTNFSHSGASCQPDTFLFRGASGRSLSRCAGDTLYGTCL